MYRVEDFMSHPIFLASDEKQNRGRKSGEYHPLLTISTLLNLYVKLLPLPVRWTLEVIRLNEV